MMRVFQQLIGQLLERTNARRFAIRYNVVNDLGIMRATLMPTGCYDLTPPEFTAWQYLYAQMFTTMIHPLALHKLSGQLYYIVLKNALLPFIKSPVKIDNETESLHKFVMLYLTDLLVLERMTSYVDATSFSHDRYTKNTGNIDVDLLRVHAKMAKQHHNGTVKDKNIVIIGAGGVGWWIAEFLALFGDDSIKVIVFDFDEIEPHNFNRLPLPYSVLLDSQLDKKKTSLLQWKLGEVFGDRLKVFPVPFSAQYFNAIQNLIDEDKETVFIEATDSPKFQLWIRKALPKHMPSASLIQTHYDLGTTVLDVYGQVDIYPPDKIPQPPDQELEEASDYAEGQSIGLPPFVVADVVRLTLTRGIGSEAEHYGPFIISKQQLASYREGIVL